MNDRQKNFSSYYSAKTARDAKDRPTDWAILGRGLGTVELVCLRIEADIETLRATAYGLYP